MSEYIQQLLNLTAWIDKKCREKTQDGENFVDLDIEKWNQIRDGIRALSEGNKRFLAVLTIAMSELKECTHPKAIEEIRKVLNDE